MGEVISQNIARYEARDEENVMIKSKIATGNPTMRSKANHTVEIIEQFDSRSDA